MRACVMGVCHLAENRRYTAMVSKPHCKLNLRMARKPPEVLSIHIEVSPAESRLRPLSSGRTTIWIPKRAES